MIFPITVSKIKQGPDEPGFCLSSGSIGKFVAIRPCAEEYKDKTFLGLYVGNLPLGLACSIDDDGTLTVCKNFHNPAIYVFDLKKIIYGAESWWGEIETEDDLRKISNEDIENIWYVKALREMQEIKP